MTEAEGYIAVCKAYFPEIYLTQAGLRAWWASEAAARRKYQFTPEQEDELIRFCRTLLWQLPEGEDEPAVTTTARKSQAKPQPKRRYGTV